MRVKLLILGAMMTTATFAQMGGVTGALNQTHQDPALQGFQNSYDDLRKEVNDLDNPEEQEATDAVEKSESSVPASKEPAHPPKNLKNKRP